MESNKVTVKIFGQDYTIMGSKPREHIMKVADYVDVKMKEISRALNSGPHSSIAVLSAVNIADDYFSALDKFGHLEVTNAQAAKDTEHYVQLWEEAKRSHLQQQEEIKELSAQKEALRQELEIQVTEMDIKVTELQKLIDQKDGEVKSLREESAKIEGQIMESSSDIVNELEAKYKDLESSFFDIQMENIQLKGEIDRYKKKME